jgi:hypothetical protein
MARRRGREKVLQPAWMRMAHVIQSAEEKRSSDLELMHQVLSLSYFPFKFGCVELNE